MGTQVVPLQRMTRLLTALPWPVTYNLVPAPSPTSTAPQAKLLAQHEIPAPKALHDEPFHLATLLQMTPPARSNKPETTSTCCTGPAPSGSYSVNDIPGQAPPLLFVKPLPSADHEVPFHLAMPGAERPPAIQKSPAAYSAPEYAARDLTPLGVMPLPSADQDEPFHRATQLANTPFTPEKLPPA
jgi:hypothetical protein